jgi:hypothetical protein
MTPMTVTVSLAWFHNCRTCADSSSVSEVIKNADMSPVIFERVPGSWAVMMGGPHRNARGEDQSV